MKMSTTLHEELLLAIQKRESESFEMQTTGGLKHFISSEGKSQGLYIGVIPFDGKNFEIYMV